MDDLLRDVLLETLKCKFVHMFLRSEGASSVARRMSVYFALMSLADDVATTRWDVKSEFVVRDYDLAGVDSGVMLGLSASQLLLGQLGVSVLDVVFETLGILDDLRGIDEGDCAVLAEIRRALSRRVLVARCCAGVEKMMEAYVTLATNDIYAVGACVLAQSIRATRTDRALVVLVTDGVSVGMRRALSSLFDRVRDVEVIESTNLYGLTLLGRPDLHSALTKIRCFELVDFQKCVFIDADCLLLSNVDDLFETDAQFAAAPDMGWPDCFNSGLFVFRPDQDVFNNLISLAEKTGSFDGLLNEYFGPEWRNDQANGRIPFCYNVSPSAIYTYKPALHRFKSDVKMIHFLGQNKPWKFRYRPDTCTVEGLGGNEIEQEFYGRWWRILYECLAMEYGTELLENLKGRNKPQGFPSSEILATQTNPEFYDTYLMLGNLSFWYSNISN